MPRCEWAGTEGNMVAYHDEVWGVPVRDDQRLFEFLILEGAQAGLSWSTVLNKFDGYYIAFDGFDARRMVAYDDEKIASLLQNPGIIRNRLKVNAAITNAKLFLKIQEEGSFSDYVWSFVDGEPIQNSFESLSQIPATTEESDAMSKDMKKRGFKFVGSTICYAFMQAVGLVNDHVVSCFRYDEVRQLAGK